MKIEVLGTGCPNCNRTFETIRSVLDERGVQADLVKVTDMMQIVSRGILSTPAVLMDGRVVSYGRVPTREDVLAWLAS